MKERRNDYIDLSYELAESRKTDVKILQDISRVREILGTLTVQMNVYSKELKEIKESTDKNSKILYGNGKMGLVNRFKILLFAFLAYMAINTPKLFDFFAGKIK